MRRFSREEVWGQEYGDLISLEAKLLSTFLNRKLVVLPTGSDQR